MKEKKRKLKAESRQRKRKLKGTKKRTKHGSTAKRRI